MNLPPIVSSRQFKTIALVTAGLSLVYIFINAFVFGGDEFVTGLNNNLTVPLAILTVVLSIILGQNAGNTKNNRYHWRHMIAGWALWTVAEILWTVFAILQQEVPYPSWADFFWLLGYLPMWLGLLSRARSLPVKPTSGQLAVIGGITLATVIFTIVFVLQPIIQNNDPEQLLESILNLVFPLFDLLLLIIILYLFFGYEQGDYGFGWRLLLIGFLVHQISNLVFSSASSFDLYYPEQKANWISTLAIDVPYNLSYVFWAVGIYVLGLILGEHSTFELNTQPRPVPNTHILIFTKSDGEIIDVSHNFHSFFAFEAAKGKSLEQALELTEADAREIKERIRAGKKLSDQKIQLKRASGTLQDGWLCGVAIYSPQGEYSGANYLIRTQVDEDQTLDNKLSEAEKSVVRHFLAHNISNEGSEIRQLLLGYYLSQIKALFNLAFHEGGATMSQLLLDELQATSQHYGWKIKLTPQDILDGQAYPIEVLRNALPIFLETAKRFVSRINGEELVEAELQRLQDQMGATVHKNISRYGKVD